MRRIIGTGLAALAVFGLTRITAFAKSNTSGPSIPGSNPATSLFNLFLSLVVIIVLVILTIRFLARKTQVKQTGDIEVLAARQLAPNRFVEVIEVQGKRYLVGVGEQITLLADVSDTFEVTQTAAAAQTTFGQSLTDAVHAIREKYRAGSGGQQE